MFRSVLCETTTQSQTEDRKNIEYKFVSKFELMELRPSIQENYVNNKMARITLFFLKAIAHFSLDGQSQLCTMADG